ncbi:hypothetical protein DIPPA_27757 [Diplonema papillatum]|nr:hypothetical protein DIPPA_27757 [Diplonema papillatum]
MDITQTIVQEVVSQCGRRGFVVSASLARFYIIMQLLLEEKDASRAVELPPERIEALVDSAVVTLTRSDCPSLETFKLQASITTTKREQLNRSRTEEVQHKAKSQQLVHEICSKTDPDQVCGDMTLYVLHESKLFSSTNDLVQKETMTALESVIPRGSIAPFISQKFEEKAKQLDELWRIVWGIRLFNKKSPKGGAGIPAYPEETETILEAGRKACETHYEQAEKQAHHYQLVLTTPSIQMTPEERQRLVDEYINRKQFSLYVNNIQKMLEESQSRSEAVKPSWAQLVSDVRDMVGQSSSIPKSAIYPKFIDMSDRWAIFRGLHDDVVDCKKLLDLVVAFQAPFHVTLSQTQVDAALATKAQESVPNKLLIASEVQNPSVTYLSELADGTEKRLEFNGYCIPSLIDGGLLLDGRHGSLSPGYLHLHVNDTFYAFSSERLLKAFARDPFRYLSTDLLQACAKQPELIHLLGLQNELPQDIFLQGTRAASKPREIVKVDSQSQTGQIDPFKDHKYEWNEWELRRLALKVANLRSKKTHSVQTNQSHNRRDNDAQTYLPKTQETQTMQSKATQPSKKVQYIKGLRGNASARVQVVQMEFDQ